MAGVGPLEPNKGYRDAIWALDKLKLTDDQNLILTVHFYEPMEFTHQGASWAKGEATPAISTRTAGQYSRSSMSAYRWLTIER